MSRDVHSQASREHGILDTWTPTTLWQVYSVYTPRCAYNFNAGLARYRACHGAENCTILVLLLPLLILSILFNWPFLSIFRDNAGQAASPKVKFWEFLKHKFFTGPHRQRLKGQRSSTQRTRILLNMHDFSFLVYINSVLTPNSVRIWTVDRLDGHETQQNLLIVWDNAQLSTVPLGHHGVVIMTVELSHSTKLDHNRLGERACSQPRRVLVSCRNNNHHQRHIISSN